MQTNAALLLLLLLLLTCLQLVYASACLRELPGCLCVATNLDHADYIGNDRMMPGTGALVAALQVASGVEPVSRPACAAASASAAAAAVIVDAHGRGACGSVHCCQ